MRLKQIKRNTVFRIELFMILSFVFISPCYKKVRNDTDAEAKAR